MRSISSLREAVTGHCPCSGRGKWPETKGVYDRRERLNIFKDIYVHPRANPALRRRLGAYRGMICRSLGTAEYRRGPLSIVLWEQARRARRLQDGLRRFQDGPRRFQDHPKTAQVTSKTPQDAPKTRILCFLNQNEAKLAPKSHSQAILC